jgi:hypothetical protein
MVLFLGIEDEHRAHALVCRIDLALRIDAHSVGANQLEGELGNSDFFSGTAYRPGGPSKSACAFFVQEAGIDLFSRVEILERNPGNRRGVRPYDLGNIKIARHAADLPCSQEGGVSFFPCRHGVALGKAGTQYQERAPALLTTVRPRISPRRSESGLHFGISLTSRPYVRKVQSIGVAGFAEIHIVLLVFHQHPRLVPRVRLMAGEAVHRKYSLGFRDHDVANRVVLRGVSQAVFQGQNGYFTEVVFRQFHLAIEDRDQVLAFHFLRTGVGPVALEAKRIHVRLAQQMRVVATVRLVAGGASQVRGRLMHVLLL